MCGIAGIIGNNLDELNLNHQKILNSMSHRGPNYQNYHYSNKFAFYHSLLKIMDLSDKSHQPFFDKKGNIIIFNGSIFNYKEIKKKNFYHKFQTNTDTEVILFLYNKYGINFIHFLEGMFALAIYDKRKDKIFIIRDQSGIKPLFFFSKEKNFYFASEIKILKKNFFSHQNLKLNNKEVIRFYNFRHYYNNGETFFKEISLVEPGSYIEFDLKTNKHKKKIFNKFNDILLLNKKNKQKYFDDLFKKTIKKHSITEHKKVACLLSGGIDSSLVAVALAKINSGAEIHTFSIKENNVNHESKNITKLNQEFNFKSHVYNTNQIDFFTEHKETIRNLDNPTIDGSMIAHRFLCKKMKDENFKVFFSGNGGDEIFFGYPSHRIGYLSTKKNKIKTIRNLKKYIKFNVFYLLSRAMLEKFNIILKNLYKNLTSNFNFFLNIKNFTYIDYYKEFNKDPFKNIILNNIYKWTQPMFLDYEDKNAMAFGLENRVPFFDKKLIEYSFSIRSDDHFKNGHKTLLKNSKFLPNYVKNVKDKIGFPGPIYNFLIKDKNKIINEINSNFNDIPNLSQKKLIKLFKNLNKNFEIIYRIYSYGVWYNQNFNKKKVFIASFGLWHSYNIAENFSDMNIKVSLFTSYPKNKKLNNSNKIYTNFFLFLLNRFKFILGSKLKYKFAYLVNQYFTIKAIKKAKQSNIYILFSGNALEFLKLDKKNKIYILERCSTHYSHQKKILENLHIKFGINPSINEQEYETKMESRELQEYRLADYISVPSNYVKKTFIDNGINEKKIFVNHYGVDSKIFFPINCKIKKKSILFCGHASLRKGFHTLIDILEDLKKENFSLVHYGTTSDEIKHYLKNKKFDNFFSYKSISKNKLNFILNQHSILVLPSFEEGMAHIQLQALSSGLPTVATEESGFLDIKKTLNNVYLGELTKSGNKKELLKSILLCEKKRSFTFNSKLYLHKELNKKLSWKSYSERYLKFLDSLSLNN